MLNPIPCPHGYQGEIILKKDGDDNVWGKCSHRADCILNDEECIFTEEWVQGKNYNGNVLF